VAAFYQAPDTVKAMKPFGVLDPNSPKSANQASMKAGRDQKAALTPYMGRNRQIAACELHGSAIPSVHNLKHQILI
jgi:hypothetical protein